MLRLVLIGCMLMIAIAALAASPRADPLGKRASPTDVLQRVAGPGAADPQRRGAPTRPFVYQPCRTMTWVARFGTCKEQAQEMP
jgi:hypothetical protein